jgi:hypothetical protein
VLLEEGVHNCKYSAQATHLEKCISCNLVLIREARSFGISVRPHPYPERQSRQRSYIVHGMAIKLTGAG